MLHNDVIRPDIFTTDHSEHYISHIRDIIKEFTVNELILIVSNISCL